MGEIAVRSTGVDKIWNLLIFRVWPAESRAEPVCCAAWLLWFASVDAVWRSIGELDQFPQNHEFELEFDALDDAFQNGFDDV
jgi:hypothetical protein